MDFVVVRYNIYIYIQYFVLDTPRFYEVQTCQRQAKFRINQTNHHEPLSKNGYTWSTVASHLHDTSNIVAYHVSTVGLPWPPGVRWGKNPWEPDTIYLYPWVVFPTPAVKAHQDCVRNMAAEDGKLVCCLCLCGKWFVSLQSWSPIRYPHLHRWRVGPKNSAT